jgi:PKD repeat protein
MTRCFRHNKCLFIGLLFFLFTFSDTSFLFACGNSVTLFWIPPATNYNGTPLTGVHGYKLYYGNNSRKYTRVIDVGNETTYKVCDLKDGHKYYFAVTAYNTSGNESAYSYEVSKTIVSATKPPFANPGSAYSNAEGQAITLNASGSSDPDGRIVRYEWDVNNDGIYDYSSASATSNHIYDRAGVYIIKLRVTDNLGAASEAVTKAYISDTSPTAAFTGYPTSGTAPLTVSFSNTSSGYDRPFTYAWDFDNNGTTDSTEKNPSYTYAKQGMYTVKLTVRDSDGSSNAFTRTNYITVNNSYALSCHDGGKVECLGRTDGGSDSNNLVYGKPRLDVEYEFRIQVKDSSGRTPQYVKLYMTQRNYPSGNDFYSYRMACSGNFNPGGFCTYVTKLGPAAVHKFYFKARFSDGTLLRYPATGYITGPEVQLLTGYNLAGIPRKIDKNILGGYEAFRSTRSFRWNDRGYYTEITDTEPVKQGEGYYIQKQSSTLPELAEYGEIQDTETAYELTPGWNIISNPYSGNVELSGIKVRKGKNAPISWAKAASRGWTANAIYYRNGTDWGDDFVSESPPYARLVPWRGYWIYLYMTDDTYYLVTPKPESQ